MTATRTNFSHGLPTRMAFGAFGLIDPDPSVHIDQRAALHRREESTAVGCRFAFTPLKVGDYGTGGNWHC